MRLTALHLSPEQAGAIGRAARAAFPREACGVLLGRRDGDAARVQEVIPAANIAPPERNDRFEIAPEDLFTAHRRAREAGLEVLGHWHSHPGGPPEPSATDRALALEAGAIWLIAAIDGASAGQAPRLGAFLCEGAAPDARFRRLEIV